MDIHVDINIHIQIRSFMYINTNFNPCHKNLFSLKVQHIMSVEEVEKVLLYSLEYSSSPDEQQRTEVKIILLLF
jgi:hypothetical protein